jgi:hypothetical protein
MGRLRNEWQDFKKKYPDFEKNKELRAGSGPHLDKFENVRDRLDSAIQQVVKVAVELDNGHQNMLVAATAYGVVVRKACKDNAESPKGLGLRVRLGFQMAKC